MSKYVTDRLPMRNECRWSIYGGLQVIILADFPCTEERWVGFEFIKAIHSVSKKIQPWRSPTNLDLIKFIMERESSIKKIQSLMIK